MYIDYCDKLYNLAGEISILVIEMKEKEQNKRKTPSCNSIEEELTETKQMDRELYLFMRGGFAAK